MKSYETGVWKMPDYDRMPEMILELCQLNVKYLQQLLSDLNDKRMIPEYQKMYRDQLTRAIESNILERTLLK